MSTVLHTLSLHDALPSCIVADRPDEPSVAFERRDARFRPSLCKIAGILYVGFEDVRGQNASERREGFGDERFDFIEVLTPRERSEEHTSELQSLMRNSYDVCCLKKQKPKHVKKQQ